MSDCLEKDTLLDPEPLEPLLGKGAEYPDNPRLQETIERARYYQALGRGGREPHPRYKLCFRLERWSRLVSNVALGLDDAGHKGRFFLEPEISRLASLRNCLKRGSGAAAR